MKILLINPAYTQIYGNYAPAAKVGVLHPPLGIAYLAANIKGEHQVRILDMEINPALETTIQSFSPDYVGISFSTPLYNQAMELFKFIKEKTNCWTIAGGSHPTTLPDSVISSEHIDTVLIGEGETAINKFLENPKKGIIPRQPLIEDLDTIKFPARDLLQNEKYLFSVPGKGIVPLTSFASGRGCPYQCTFCSAHLMFGRKVRNRSIKNCIEELKEIKEKYKITHLSWIDDTLGVDKKRTFELMDAMIKEKLDMTFEGYTRVDVITKELLEKLKKAGLVRLSFGVESGNREILDTIKKGITLDQIRKAYEIADEVGIETRMSIIFGLPGETKETIKKTIKFMKSLKCNQAYVNVLVPFPGTEIYEQAKRGEKGLKLLTNDWKEYRRWGNAVINVNDLDAKDLIKWQRKALLQFYLRPKQIYYNLKRAGVKAAFKNGVSFIRSFVK
ncbi:hypothetical protein LCGC14_0374250 [marine sediment metagenome]|uniref:Uncharacterized protein n=1 Tax=marine sediment metagenome TaxID=412755 RepID=A0A0F9T441_9ZZZZ